MSYTELFLSDPEILALTGRHTRTEQVKWLRAHEVRFRKCGDGSLFIRRGDEKNVSEPIGANPREYMTAEQIVARAVPYKPECGIYFLILEGEIVYVGQSTDYHSRVKSHTLAKAIQFDAVAFVRVAHGYLNNVEAEYIARLRPRFNIAGKKA
jgi:hypothetical protein